jgi:hypothetical protein
MQCTASHITLTLEILLPFFAIECPNWLMILQIVYLLPDDRLDQGRKVLTSRYRYIHTIYQREHDCFTKHLFSAEYLPP